MQTISQMQKSNQISENDSKIQTADVQVLVGDFKHEMTTFQMDASFYFDLNRLERISKLICDSIKEKEEKFNNKVVIKLDLINKSQKKEVISIIQKLLEQQHVDKKTSLFSLLNINITLHESATDENSIYLITDFIDDIHLMIDDVRKIFCDHKNKFSDSFLEFELKINNKFSEFEKELQSSFYFLMQSTYFKLKLKQDNNANNQIFNILGLGQDESLKFIFSKIRNIKLNLKYKSFDDIPNKQDFMTWIFQLQRARYSPEEIVLLKQLTKCISDKVTFNSIFRDSNTTIEIKTGLQGLFNFIQEREIND